MNDRKFYSNKDKYYKYLNKLRDDDDAPNMFDAVPYLVREFSLVEEDARFVLQSWMNQY